MNLDDLYEQFYHEENRYKSNAYMFELLNTNKNLIDVSKGDINKVARLKADYAIMLAQDENYLLALPLLQESESFLEEHKEEITKVNIDEYIKALKFNIAKCYYYTKNIAKSSAIFKFLYKEYPNNVIYKNWYISSINYSYDNIINKLYAVMLLPLILHFLFDYLKMNTISLSVLILLFMMLAVVWVLQLKKYFNKKKVR